MHWNTNALQQKQSFIYIYYITGFSFLILVKFLITLYGICHNMSSLPVQYPQTTYVLGVLRTLRPRGTGMCLSCVSEPESRRQGTGQEYTGLAQY